MTRPTDSKKRRQSTSFVLILLAVAALLSCVGWYYYEKSNSQNIEDINKNSLDGSTTTALKTNEQGDHSATDGRTQEQATTLNAKAVAPVNAPDTSMEQLTDTDATGASQSHINTQHDIAVVTAVDELNAFFIYLDKQKYIQALELPENTKNTFSTLVQKLIVNPPVITGEADDLYTLLKNTAHFFRVIGGKNIQFLKAIVTNEPDKLENLATHFFVVLNTPEALQENFNITLSETALYDYSCFLLNTMGGRLYMFRRDIELRMLVNYYSLLFADLAEKKGLNSHGINLKPFITGLIDEMEKHGQDLSMRDQYLEKLYTLEQQ